MAGTGEVVELVGQVKAAVRGAALADPATPLEITQVRLDVRVTVQREAGGGVTVKVLDIGSTIASNDVQTISLTLDPLDMEDEASDPAADGELAEAVRVIRSAVAEAWSAPPRFALKEASVTLAMGRTKQGKLKLFVGAGARSETIHTVLLTLSRA